MKYYKDSDNNLFGFDENQDVPFGLTEMTKTEIEIVAKQRFDEKTQADIAKLDYKTQRVLHYPNIGEFADAWVKNDEVALEEYRQACLAVKAKYPKPEGF